MDARQTALTVLRAIRTDNSWADGALKDALSRQNPDPRDAALVTALVGGVLRNRALLDWYIDALLTGKKKLQPVLRDILETGAYQILYMDRVPDSAAVNEAVKQAKRLSQKEAGLVNGVLRRLSREKQAMTPPRDYHIRYSHPEALVNLMKASVGKKLGAILEADNQPPEVCAQWNSLAGTKAALCDAWDCENISHTKHPWMKGCYLLSGAGAVDRLASFREGRFQIQDPAARLSVCVLDPRPGMRVLDLCAAPGGKSMAAAQIMENRGHITACDLHGGKLPEIASAAARLGVSIVSTEENDATVFRPDWEGAFDAVIADVPCSGLGVIRKKPDIRYKDLSAMEKLPELQAAILEQASRYVSEHGVLLYSTCTILCRENEEVVHGFLARHPEFRPEPLALPEPLQEQETGMITLYQGIDCCDGFFICKLRRLV